MARRSGRVNTMAKSVTTAVTTAARIIIIPTQCRIPSSSFAPKRCATKTANPEESPITKPITRNDIGPVSPTAASAFSSIHLPTIMVSTIL